MSTSNAHETVAANRLDPNVSADGHMTTGSGVGGQSPAHVHDEGVEHIKDRLDERGAPLGGTSATTSAASPAHAPASNPGADDPTAGIAQGSGGVSSTAYIGSPVTEQPQTIVGTIKSYLGLGTEGEARHAEDIAPATTAASGTHGTAASDLPGTHSTGTHDVTSSSAHNTNPSSSTGYVAAAGSAVAGAGTAAAAALGYDEKNKHTTGGRTSLPDRTREPTAAGSSFDGTTGHPTTDRTAENVSNSAANASFDNPDKSSGKVPDPSTDTSLKGTSTSQAGSANEKPSTGEGSSQDNAKDIKSGANPKALEHPDAIPTAGGEKLGQKHWGESKTIPDNPKPVESDVGVSSSEGQPTSEVKDNTSKNTGGATGGPHGHTSSTTGAANDTDGKESLTDKIKDKLHIGKK